MDWRSEFEFVRAYTRHSLGNIVQGPKGGQRFKKPIVSIQNGLLAGVDRWIENPKVIVGSGDKADIILLDDGIEPHHIELGVNRDFLGLIITVKALAPNVNLSTYGAVQKGETRIVRGPAQIVINRIVLKVTEQTFSDATYTSENSLQVIEHPQTPTNTDTPPHMSGKVRSLFPVPVSKRSGAPRGQVSIKEKLRSPMLLGALSAILSISGAVMLSGIDLGLNKQTPQREEVKVANNTVQTSSFIALFRLHLEQAGLHETINVTHRNDGEIVVTGTLPDSLMPKWQEMLRWYDTQNNPPTLIKQIEKASPTSNAPQIRSVSSGSDPYVILRDGRKLRPGQTLTENWKLKNITSDGVLLTHRNKDVLIRYE